MFSLDELGSGRRFSPIERQFRGLISDDVELLAILYSRPIDAAMLHTLRATTFPVGLGLDLSDPQGRNAVAAMSAVLDDIPLSLTSSTADDLFQMFVDVHQLGCFGAPPVQGRWERTGGAGRHAAAAMRRWMDRHQLRVPADSLLADDHLVHQLDLLAYLLRHGDGHAALAEAATFIDRHLLPWLPRYADHMVRAGAPVLYASLAVLTATYLAELRLHLSAWASTACPAADWLALSRQAN